jgi:hypothetical protein
VPGTPGTGRQVREPLEAAQVRRGHGVISVRGLMGTPDPGEGGIVETEGESGGDLVGCWVFLWSLEFKDWIAFRFFLQIVTTPSRMRLFWEEQALEAWGLSLPRWLLF